MFVFYEPLSDRWQLIPFRDSSHVQWLPCHWMNRTKRLKTTYYRHPCLNSGTFLPQRYRESVYRLRAPVTGWKWLCRLRLRAPTVPGPEARLVMGGDRKPPHPVYSLSPVVATPATGTSLRDPFNACMIPLYKTSWLYTRTVPFQSYNPSQIRMTARI